MVSLSNSLIFSFLIIFTIVCHSCLGFEESRTERETLEIIIGVGGGGGDYAPAPSPEFEVDCPPPPPEPICPSPQPSPPPPPPPPPPTPPPPFSMSPPGSFSSKNIERDYYTIQKFKKRFTIDPMNIAAQWVGPDVCNYPGFDCAELPDKKVPALAAANFNGYGFDGPNLQLTDFLDQLFDLAVFHINSNNFTGQIPNGIGNDKIKFLHEFDISNNKYAGGFPTSVLAATQLTFLDVRFNSFSGSVPKQVFDMDLDVLFINNNEFSGNLPENLGSTPVLYLTLANNKFTGPIPKSIGNAKNLLEILLLNNQLTGFLPYEIGFLTNTTLFDASCNKLTGPIPYSFACLAKMQILNFARNHLYGHVPEILCKLPNLSNLTLSHNYFTQVGPVCRKLIELKRLDVLMNCILDLPEQRSASACAQFFSKPRSCADEKSMTYIPCPNLWYLGLPEESSEYQEMKQQSQAPAQAPRSYGALLPNNKL